MKKNSLCIFFFLFILLFTMQAQNQHVIDSLKRKLKEPLNDTMRIKAAIDLALNIRYSDPDTSIIIANSTLKESEALDFEPGYVKSHYAIGMAEHMRGNYDDAIKKFDMVIPEFEKMGRKIDVAKVLLSKGLSLSSKNQYSEALEVYYKSLKILEGSNETKVRATLLGNIGIIYWYNMDYKKSIQFHEEALKLDRANNNPVGVARHLGNLGASYLDLAGTLRSNGRSHEAEEKYKLALERLMEARELLEKQDNRSGMSLTLGNIASAYNDLGDTAKSMQYYLEAYKIDETIDNKQGMSRNMGNMGWIYLSKGKYDSAIVHYTKALELLKGIQDFSMLAKFHGNISEAYEEKGEHKLALRHYKESVLYRDSLYNIENTKKNLETEMNFELQKKEAAALQERQKQALVRNVFIGGFIVMFIMAALIFRSYRIKRKANKEISEQKELLETKNKEITDSILYAKRIQKAHLPHEEYISKKLNELNKRS